MRRQWECKVEVNGEAQRVETVVVTTNLEAKAKKLAHQAVCKKVGYPVCPFVLSCKPVEDGQKA